MLLIGLQSVRSEPVVTSLFMAPSGPLTAGAKASVWLYCLNNLQNEDRQFFDLTLNGSLIAHGRTDDVVLTLNTNSSKILASIAPGGFVREEYVFTVPPDIQGQVDLDVSNYNRLALTVTGGPAVLPVVQSPPVAPKSVATAKPVTAPAMPAATNTSPVVSIAAFLDNHLYFYEPIYFILGSYPAAEFQFSLKYRLFDLANTADPLGDLYFAYTQTSYWDLLTSDPSFYDTSYKPSVFFYRTNVFQTEIMDEPVRLDLQAGAEHESNGRGGTGERSLNTAYLQPTISFGRLSQLQLAFQPRAMYYFHLSDNNPDLPDYRGYAELLTTLTRKGAESWQDFQLATMVRAGDYGSHTSVECDLRFNLLQYFHFSPSIDVQYFAGYGQTLRQYNEYSHGIRAGLCLYY